MAYPQGINFRATLAYVTDVSPAEFQDDVLPDYPRTTAQGNTVGWEHDVASLGRDRSTSPDARLAGMTYAGATPFDYRFDLSSAGDWKLGLALGDYSYSHGPMRLEIFDTTTSLGRLVNDQTTSASQRYFDASGVERTAAAWPGSHVLVTKTFATTICRFRLGGTADTSNIAHAYVEAAAAALTPPFSQQSVVPRERTRWAGIEY